MKMLLNIAALGLIVVGFLGMLVCLPDVFSPSYRNLFEEIIPFSGALILVLGGCLTLYNLSNRKSLPKQQDVL